MVKLKSRQLQLKIDNFKISSIVQDTRECLKRLQSLISTYSPEIRQNRELQVSPLNPHGQVRLPNRSDVRITKNGRAICDGIHVVAISLHSDTRGRGSPKTASGTGLAFPSLCLPSSLSGTVFLYTDSHTNRFSSSFTTHVPVLLSSF